MSQKAYKKLANLHFRFKSRQTYPSSFIGAATILDAALLILAFYLATSPFVMQPGIALNLPEKPFVSGSRFDSAVVTVSDEEMIFCNDELVKIENLSELLSEQKEAGKSSLILEADQEITHGTLVKIYNQARKAGILDITVATQSPKTALRNRR